MPAKQVSRIVFEGRDGNDTFTNNTSVPAVAYGGNGNDRLTGGVGSDELYGDDGNDVLLGNNGDDVLYGGNGNDVLKGGAGNDSAQGDDGIDELWGNVGNDVLRGSDGDDQLNGGDGSDTLYGDAGADRLWGGNLNDLLFGGTGHDVLEGESGNDRLYGGTGEDRLYGSSGDDSLFGGVDYEPDTLEGGPGVDRFLVSANDERETRDVIVDGSGIDSRDGNEARIVFVSGESISLPGWDMTWTESEVAVIDGAFTQLFAARNDNALLKDTQSDEPLTFYKDQLPVGCLGYNQSPYQTFHRAIVIGDWDEHAWEEGDLGPEELAKHTVIHEIGHNFHEDYWGSPQADAHIWSMFKSVSGWVKNPSRTRPLFIGRVFGTAYQDPNGWYRKTNNAAEFARPYGGMNACEDWATAWGLYFSQNFSTKSRNAQLARKLELVGMMVRSV